MTSPVDKESGFQAKVAPNKAAFEAFELLNSGKVAEAEKVIRTEARRAREAAERLFGGKATTEEP